jgi:DUF4097 and DUF4098 domain-containing protein YvlB
MQSLSSKTARVTILALLLGTLGCTGNPAGGTALTKNLSEPLNGATSASVDINSATGNLTVDRFSGDEPVLASGALQYFGDQEPTHTLNVSDGHATLTLRGVGDAQPCIRLPWQTDNGAVEWLVHLNPGVPSDLTVHTGGGNVKLNLAGMIVKGLSADASGGNVDVVLPNNAAGLSVTAKTGAGNVNVEIGGGTTGRNSVDANSGAGNVSVRLPSGVAAKVNVTSGMGKVIVDSQFSKTDADTYQSPGYDDAADRVEITLHSGAGDVSVSYIS